MPRPGRIAVEGGIYHVSNRAGRGERLFAREEEADGLVGLLREVVERDGLTVFAAARSRSQRHEQNGRDSSRVTGGPRSHLLSHQMEALSTAAKLTHAQ